jgi:hypothetical protein
MSGNCAPTYNFYNCCDCSGATGGAGTPGAKTNKFIWAPDSTSTWLPDFVATTNPDPLGMGGKVSSIDSDKKDFLTLQALHVPVDLLNLSILRFSTPVPSFVDVPPSYTASVDLEIVVLDYLGNTLRTISQAPVNYKTLPDRKWTAIPLTGVTADLSIQLGEVVAARVQFGAPDLYVQLWFTLSGIGQF